MSWILWLVGAVVAFLVIQTLHLGVVLASTDQATNGLGYYGRPAADREAFRDRLRRHAALLTPILRLVARSAPFTFEKASFEQDGLHGPKGSCSPETFAAARAYRPRSEDVFVVTQMKCGTTWMQQMVLETVMRGDGDLVESGTALYAVSPWLESTKSVPVDEAPPIGGERPARIIKTHMPVAACPLDDAARYVYVARHPVSCFASCVDFIVQNAGPLSPRIDAIERWFCSDEMWWGPWPAHVEGWWRASKERDNVMFVHFEEMKADASAVARRVGSFLGLEPLSDDELDAVVEKSGFAFMRENAATFEMHPPHLLAPDAELFLKGTADRHRDVPDEVRGRVAAWCARGMDGASYPLGERYPDVAEAD